MNTFLQISIFIFLMMTNGFLMAQTSEKLIKYDSINEQKHENIVVDGKSVSQNDIADYKKKRDLHGNDFLLKNPFAKKVLTIVERKDFQNFNEKKSENELRRNKSAKAYELQGKVIVEKKIVKEISQ
jgi:hypothetical protein